MTRSLPSTDPLIDVILNNENRKTSALGFSGFAYPKVAQITQIFEEGFTTGLNTTDVWNENLTGAGTVNVVDSEGRFDTVNSGDIAEIQTKLPHVFKHGFSTTFRIRAYTATIPTVQKVEFGMFDTDNGYFFRLSSAGLDVVIRRKTVDDVTNIYPSFAAGAHSYGFQMLNGNRIEFVVDDVSVKTAGSGANNLIAKSNLPTTIRLEQTGAGTPVQLKTYGHAIIRDGQPNLYNASGELITTSGTPSTPPGATNVIQPIAANRFKTLTPNQVIDEYYTITNGATLTLQQLKGRVESAGTGKSIRLRLFSDPLGITSVGPGFAIPASWEEIDLLMGNNFNQDTNLTGVFVGDGTSRMVLRYQQVGSATISAFSQWQGFETT